MSESPIRTFESLECWKACRELRRFIAVEFCKCLPKDERYRLGDQIIRAARSSTSNIAEGYGRYHYLDNAKFCSNARGSVWEVLDHMITAEDEGFAEPRLVESGRKLVETSIALLNGYISYLQKAARTYPNNQ